MKLNGSAHLQRIMICVASLVSLSLSSCDNPGPSPGGSKLVDPAGGFTLYVSNQSPVMKRVDLQVEIDGELVVKDVFSHGTGHTFEPTTLNLAKGQYTIRFISRKGKIDQTRQFNLQDQDVGKVIFLYHHNVAEHPEPWIQFDIKKGSPIIY